MCDLLQAIGHTLGVGLVAFAKSFMGNVFVQQRHAFREWHENWVNTLLQAAM